MPCYRRLAPNKALSEQLSSSVAQKGNALGVWVGFECGASTGQIGGTSTGAVATAWLLHPQELMQEQGTSAPPLMDRDLLDRLLTARLSDVPSGYPQAPFPYLLGCYRRAAEELRSARGLKDPQSAARVADLLVYCMELIVSYSGLMLFMEMFPQACPHPPPPKKRKKKKKKVIRAIHEKKVKTGNTSRTNTSYTVHQTPLRSQPSRQFSGPGCQRR
jgi:hypothetical protein